MHYWFRDCQEARDKELGSKARGGEWVRFEIYLSPPIWGFRLKGPEMQKLLGQSWRPDVVPGSWRCRELAGAWQLRRRMRCRRPGTSLSQRRHHARRASMSGTQLTYLIRCRDLARAGASETQTSVAQTLSDRGLEEWRWHTVRGTTEDTPSFRID